jgi:hypothetical protein
MNSFRPWIVVAAAVVLAAGARANMSFTLTNVPTTVNAGDVGDTFEVDLINTGASFPLSSFSFSIVTSNPDITFEQSTTATGAPYVFSGDSGADSFLGGVNGSTPGSPFGGFDFTADSKDITVPASSTVGLGLVSFNVSPGAMTEAVTFSFDPTMGANSLGDNESAVYTVDTSDNASVQVDSGVPEPSMLLPLSALAMAAVGWRRRKRL